MTKRYAVALANTTKDQDDEFLNYIKDNGMSWWRYVGNFWLLIDHKENKSIYEIRDDIQKILPGVHHIVLDITGAEHGEWAGYGPNKEPNNMFQWLHDTWDKKQ